MMKVGLSGSMGSRLGAPAGAHVNDRRSSNPQVENNSCACIRRARGFCLESASAPGSGFVFLWKLEWALLCISVFFFSAAASSCGGRGPLSLCRLRDRGFVGLEAPRSPLDLFGRSFELFGSGGMSMPGQGQDHRIIFDRTRHHIRPRVRKAVSLLTISLGHGRPPWAQTSEGGSLGNWPV